MNDKQKAAEAVSLKNGVIVEVGSDAHVFRQSRFRPNNIKLINLKGKTMLPGFYDAHSHLAIHSLAKSTRLSLASPPIGNITSIDQIKNTISSYIK
jgi:predicted amidohydrolase YtcJ